MLKATYYLETQLDPGYVAEQIAKEQSAGHSRTWAGISNESRKAGYASVIDVAATELRGNSLPVFQAHPSRLPVRERSASIVTIQYDNWEEWDGLVALLNVVAGEPQHLAVVSALRLERLDLSTKLDGSEFSGPAFGSGWFCRELGSRSRGLVCAPIKPSSGLLPAEAARLAYEAAVGGAHIVKDDELAFSTRRVPGTARSRAIAQAIREAEQETGERKYISQIQLAQAWTSFDVPSSWLKLGRMRS